MPKPLDSIYITYWSLLDPLCQSQTLPYLRSLSRRGYRIGLMTFEQPRWAMTNAQRRSKQKELASEGIHWHPLRYHKWPPVLSTLYDIGVGSFVATTMARRCGASLVHGRSSVSCAMAAFAAKLAGVCLFVDADGPLSQEYVDAGAWKRGSIPHRLTEWGERKALQLADVAAVLTTHRKEQVAPWLSDSTPVYVLPCAVDLNRFRPIEEGREELRQALGLRGTVFVYAGKPGGWYDTEAMVAFLSAAKEVFHPMALLVLTQDGVDEFAALCEEAGVPMASRSVPPQEMPHYLSCADVGLCFLKPFPSKLACSPIKLGEYLGCGLPVVSTSGCGDYDELIEAESIGVVVANADRAAYPRAARELAQLLKDPGIRVRCRDAVQKRVGLDEVVAPRYAEIYAHLLGSAGSDTLRYPGIALAITLKSASAHDTSRHGKLRPSGGRGIRRTEAPGRHSRYGKPLDCGMRSL
ncbi:MAG: glycosyltransferase [Myxococcales bacterium]